MAAGAPNLDCTIIGIDNPSTEYTRKVASGQQTFIDCDIEIERFISRTFSLGVELLNEKELKFGSALIDLEFEKISLGLFKNLALVHSATFPIGINHITKDISKVCSLNLKESKNIINNIDFSFQNNQRQPA